MSARAHLAAVGSERPASWEAALQNMLREEFVVSPLVAPAGSPLLPSECAVAGCPRVGSRTPWGRFEARICHAHHKRWRADGSPAEQERWLGEQAPPKLLRPVASCTVAGCHRSASQSGLCGSHRWLWDLAGKPEPERFASAAPAAPASTTRCRAPGCVFPAVDRRSRAGLCDAHLARFCSWKHQHIGLGRGDGTVEGYLDWLVARVEGTGVVALALPDAPLLELELRFALQHRHDHGEGFIQPPRWGEMVGMLNALGVESLLDGDRDWWNEQRTDAGRIPRWANYVNYAWMVLFAFRVSCGQQDPWAPDVWHTPALPLDQDQGRIRTADWRAIDPAWLRELTKRWARHRLRHGISTTHVNGVRLAAVRLVQFSEAAGWPLGSPACLTRELFDAFLDHVRLIDQGVHYKRQIAYGVKQLFEDAHDLGWISLRNSRVYLPGELPTPRERLPRALPAAIVKRLNQPGALELLKTDQRAAALVMMDCGLRATDTARLRFDVVMVGSDGAPYLRYWNHKRRREAIVPLTDRAADVIAAQQAWVRGHFPDCEWLFPRLNANGHGHEPMSYAFVYRTLRRWSRALDLRDEHGEPLLLHPHSFRHTYATGLVNNDVDLFSVQSLLDHDSPEMTWRYARLSKETLRCKWEQGQQRINIRGEVVPLDVAGELSDAAWAKEQIARAKQSLPNGYCGLPLRQTCPHPNACLTCSAFLTDQTFLPQHREQLARAEQLIELGKANGNERLVEINEADRVSLVAIIERAEQLVRENPTQEEEGEEEGDVAA